ncbi:hypothetical protein GJ744_011297 [Endocarpon pusillum]|uniref:SnoaL-like domain-containing protein n=1 Tax=Endocarpon pusillum TaxID=364733 RepID=A0A8H7ATS9_9EURO|nr:hypothetical protein GJ744_011297 [Endocarpon pusillum]
MAPADTLKATANQFVEAANSLDMDRMIAVRSPDCVAYILPKSLAREPMSNEKFRQTYTGMVSNFRHLAYQVQSTVVDTTLNTVVMHIIADGETIAGPWLNEYMYTLQMTEDGTQVRGIHEFIDTAKSKENRERLLAKVAEVKQADASA